MEMYLCNECLYFGYDVLGRCVCRREDKEKPTASYIAACKDFKKKRKQK